MLDQGALWPAISCLVFDFQSAMVSNLNLMLAIGRRSIPVIGNLCAREDSSSNNENGNPVCSWRYMKVFTTYQAPHLYLQVIHTGVTIAFARMGLLLLGKRPADTIIAMLAYVDWNHFPFLFFIMANSSSEDNKTSHDRSRPRCRSPLSSRK